MARVMAAEWPELMGEQQLAAWHIWFGTTSMIPGVQFAASQNERNFCFNLSHKMCLIALLDF
jgi:hypothetical protein